MDPPPRPARVTWTAVGFGALAAAALPLALVALVTAEDSLILALALAIASFAGVLGAACALVSIGLIRRWRVARGAAMAVGSLLVLYGAWMGLGAMRVGDASGFVVPVVAGLAGAGAIGALASAPARAWFQASA